MVTPKPAPMTPLSRCRHRNSWLLLGGLVEWCYQCGAWRQLKANGLNSLAVVGPWCVPTGPNGENPHEWFRKRKAQYEKARATKRGRKR